MYHNLSQTSIVSVLFLLKVSVRGTITSKPIIHIQAKSSITELKTTQQFKQLKVL